MAHEPEQSLQTSCDHNPDLSALVEGIRRSTARSNETGPCFSSDAGSILAAAASVAGNTTLPAPIQRTGEDAVTRTHHLGQSIRHSTKTRSGHFPSAR